MQMTLGHNILLMQTANSVDDTEFISACRSFGSFRIPHGTEQFVQKKDAKSLTPQILCEQDLS